MSRFFNFDQPQPLNLDTPVRQSLQDLLKQVQARVEGGGQSHWVLAEIAELRQPSSGHIYFELVQRQGEAIVAKCRATCWRTMANKIITDFEISTGVKLKAGLEVLIRVNIGFHPVYGFALNLQEIDVNFTLGEMARRRQAIINRLQDEGLYDKNKQLSMPLVSRRLAVISSHSAAGFDDFCQQISSGLTGATIVVDLYPAIMQGDSAETSILSQISRIAKSSHLYDALVVIRGGGASIDLSCFDSYKLSVAVALFPLPVVIGIGHERDTSILDLVANVSLKTPTAVADFFINKINQFLQNLENNEKLIVNKTNTILDNTNTNIQYYAERLNLKLQHQIQNQRHILDLYKQNIAEITRRLCLSKKLYLQNIIKNLPKLAQNNITQGGNKLNMLQSMINILDPKRLLQRGYSLTYVNNKLFKGNQKISVGDKVKTVVSGLSFTSEVLNIEQKGSKND